MSSNVELKKCPVYMRSCESNRMGLCQKDEIPEIKTMSNGKRICSGYKIKI